MLSAPLWGNLSAFRTGAAILYTTNSKCVCIMYFFLLFTRGEPFEIKIVSTNTLALLTTPSHGNPPSTNDLNSELNNVARTDDTAEEQPSNASAVAAVEDPLS